MPRIAYVNGRYVPHRDAAVHIEDRGYQFADGVYEVCEISRGMIVDMTAHLDRLDRSLSELSIVWPMKRGSLEHVMIETIMRNRVKDGLVYVQVTRGVAPRDHVFPDANTRPAVVVTAKSFSPAALSAKAESGLKIITVPENRWERVDIKTVGLLPNVLARQAARDRGAHEAWFVDPDGAVKEGAATNAWIVTMDGVLVTPPADGRILCGITRATAMKAAAKLGMKVEERPFTVEEAKSAQEAFVTSASSLVMPVVSIDEVVVANGKPGTVANSLRVMFFDVAEKRRA